MADEKPVSKVRQLKDALLDEMLNQFDEGRKVMITDRQTGEQHVETLSVDSKVMTVAAKLVKDFAHEAEEDTQEAERVAKLSTFLEKRRAGRNLQVVSG